MRLPDRKETEVRRLLDGGPLPVPPDLAERALVRGERLLRRRQVVLLVTWAVLLGALLAFTFWAVLAEPWTAPPSRTTPPLGW
ncbi:hypothetical protein ACWGJ2_22450 [Streptomyces sp. NPDC054796]